MFCIHFSILLKHFFYRTQKINGSSNGPTQGILKTRKPMLGTKVFAINTASSIPSYGTMRADQEASLRLPVERTKPMVRNSDKGYTNFAVMKANNNSGKNFTTGKLGKDYYRRSANY